MILVLLTLVPLTVVPLESGSIREVLAFGLASEQGHHPGRFCVQLLQEG